MKRSGAQVLIDSLVEQGVEVIFGIPGGVVIPIFDVLDRSPIRVILTRHEQGAAHAADGYARASGKVGVILVTSGPGATNITTGVATANFDSSAVVAIAGQVKTFLIGNDAFQEADTTGIMRSISKHTYLVREVNDLRRTINEAFHIASTGRPGPVVIDLPYDVTTGTAEGELPKEMDLPGYRPNLKGNARQIKLAAEAIAAARKPILYVGGGVIIAGASEELRELAERCGIPVTTTLMGLGAFPSTSPLSLGMLGMHGTVPANYAIMGSDLIIAVGARFDDRITGRIDKFAPDAKVIHIDIDPASISKNIRVDIPVVGDARHILRELLKIVQPPDSKEWLAQIADWKTKHPLRYKEGGLKPQYVVEQVWEASKGEAIICTEVGQNQMWAAQYYKHLHPRHFISSGGLGTMGFGFPAAIGAQVACPDKIVFDIAGDGSFQMNIQELATAVVNKLPVKVAILDNGFLGMVRQWQELFYNKRYASTRLTGNPDFAKVAEAYGATGILVERAEDVRPALDRAIATPGPVVLDFKVDPEENVFPMVPAGESLDRIMSGLA